MLLGKEAPYDKFSCLVAQCSRVVVSGPDMRKALLPTSVGVQLIKRKAS